LAFVPFISKNQARSKIRTICASSWHHLRNWEIRCTVQAMTGSALCPLTKSALCSSWHRFLRPPPHVAAVQAARSLFICRFGICEERAAWIPFGMIAADTICSR
jgi:hypothetical protein